VNVVSWDSESESGTTRRVSIDEEYDEEGTAVVTATLTELLALQHSMDPIRRRGDYFAMNERVRNGGNIHNAYATFPYTHSRHSSPRFNALIPSNDGTIDPRLLQPFYRPGNSLADSEDVGPASIAIEETDEEQEMGEGW